jgi:hypothetical protein
MMNKTKNKVVAILSDVLRLFPAARVIAPKPDIDAKTIIHPNTFGFSLRTVNGNSRARRKSPILNNIACGAQRLYF